MQQQDIEEIKVKIYDFLDDEAKEIIRKNNNENDLNSSIYTEDNIIYPLRFTLGTKIIKFLREQPEMKEYPKDQLYVHWQSFAHEAVRYGDIKKQFKGK